MTIVTSTVHVVNQWIPVVNDTPTSEFHQYCQKIPRQYGASSKPVLYQCLAQYWQAVLALLLGYNWHSTAPVVNTVYPPTFPPGPYSFNPTFQYIFECVGFNPMNGKFDFVFQGLICLWMVSVTLILNGSPQKIVQRCQITAQRRPIGIRI